MSMGMSMGMRMQPQMLQTQSIKMAASLRITVSLRIQLLEALHGKKFKPEADCPKCHHELTPVEILSGFLDDATDISTECPKCKHRFNPKLAIHDHASSVEMPFYCALQVQEMLDDKSEMEADALMKEHSAIFHSALFHFGNIATAFESVGIEYKHDPVTNWEVKIHSFLGKLPDTQIAAAIHQSVYAVRKLRNSKKIPPYKATQQNE